MQHIPSCFTSSSLCATYGPSLLSAPQASASVPSLPSGATCLPLQEILHTHSLSTIDFATIDIESYESAALRCFPFRLFDIRVWLVETNKAGPHLLRIFLRGGYALVADILCPFRPLHTPRTRVGVKLDSVFVRQPPIPPSSPSSSPLSARSAQQAAAPASSEFVYGPAFLPGGLKAGAGPQPTCKAWSKGEDCVQQVPSIEMDEVERDTLQLKDGTCSLPDLPLSIHPAAYRAR